MPDGWWRFAAVCVSLSLASAAVSAAGPAVPVRSDDAWIRAIVSDGCVRSTTFRMLVTTIEQLNGIVYLEQAVKLSQRMDGALLHTVAGSSALPILRVLIKTNLSRDYAIAVVAHELQHAAEALHAQRRGNAETMAAFFRSLDKESTTGKYETEEARETAARVLAELRGGTQR